MRAILFDCILFLEGFRARDHVLSADMLARVYRESDPRQFCLQFRGVPVVLHGPGEPLSNSG